MKKTIPDNLAGVVERATGVALVKKELGGYWIEVTRYGAGSQLLGHTALYTNSLEEARQVRSYIEHELELITRLWKRAEEGWISCADPQLPPRYPE